jgi:hypothetical protein
MGWWLVWIEEVEFMCFSEVAYRGSGVLRRGLQQRLGLIMKNETEFNTLSRRSLSSADMISPAVVDTWRAILGYITADCKPEEQNDCHLRIKSA